MNVLLLSMSAHITKQLGMAPGGEFRAAYREVHDKLKWYFFLSVSLQWKKNYLFVFKNKLTSAASQRLFSSIWDHWIMQKDVNEYVISNVYVTCDVFRVVFVKDFVSWRVHSFATYICMLNSEVWASIWTL